MTANWNQMSLNKDAVRTLSRLQFTSHVNIVLDIVKLDVSGRRAQPFKYSLTLC